MTDEAKAQRPTPAPAGRAIGSPPDALPECAKRAWRIIVESLPADWFAAHERQLLQEYCLTTAIFLPQVDAMIDAAGVSAGALRTRDALMKRATQLAQQLRVCASEHSRRFKAAQIKRPSATEAKMVLAHCDI